MKSILVADGDDRVADLFAYLFARDGWTVTTCLDGQRAANTLAGRASYDAVLVSNRLHDMEGVVLIRQNSRARSPARRADRHGDRHPRLCPCGRRIGRRRG